MEHHGPLIFGLFAQTLKRLYEGLNPYFQFFKNMKLLFTEASFTKKRITFSGVAFLLIILGSYIFIKFEENLVVLIQDKIITDLNQSLAANEQIEIAALKQRIAFNGKILGEVIAAPTFNLFDIEPALLSFLAIPEIKAIRVTESYGGKPYSSAWRTPKLGNGNDIPPEINLTQFDLFETFFYLEGKKIGKLEIYYSIESLLQKIQQIRQNTLAKAQENQSTINSHLKQVVLYSGLAFGGLFLTLIYFLKVSYDKSNLTVELKKVGQQAEKVPSLQKAVLSSELINRELSKSSEITQTLLDSATESTIALDGQNHVVYANANATEVLAIHKGSDLPKQVIPMLEYVDQSDNLNSSHSWLTAKLKGTHNLFQVKSIPSSLPEIHLYRLRVTSKSHIGGNIATSHLVQQITKELHTERLKIQQIEQHFQKAFQSFVTQGSAVINKLESVDMALLEINDNLKEESIETNIRALIVRAMTTALDVWTTETGKGKLELAEESMFWKIHLDQGSYKTRTLDKYLQLRTLPKNPRIRDVINTIDFILKLCSPKSEIRERLEKELEKMKLLHTLG